MGNALPLSCGCQAHGRTQVIPLCCTGASPGALSSFTIYGREGTLILDLDKGTLQLGLRDKGEVILCWPVYHVC